MRVIIAGSRSIASAEIVEKAIAASGFEVSEVVSGAARGVDRLGESWAGARGITVRRIEPDWQVYKRGAGPQRNREMAKTADALIAIWDGKSRGTADMIRTAHKFNLQVYVYRISPENE